MGVHSAPSVYDQCKDLLGIPRDEPIFILRAQDRSACATIMIYLHGAVGNLYANQERVRAILQEFRAWQEKFPGRMKEPD